MRPFKSCNKTNLSLLWPTLAITDPNDGFEGVRYNESLLYIAIGSSDFSYLTLFTVYAPYTKQLHRSDGKVVFSVDVAITAE